MSKYSVDFSKDTIIPIVSIKKFNTPSSEQKADMQKNNELRQILSDKDLANRSILRAEGRCNCNICQCSTHNHNDIVRDIYLILNCANASIFKCDYCHKFICQLCWSAHNQRHSQQNASCQS